MSYSIQGIYEWLGGLLDQPVSAIEQGVWGLFVLGFLFATVHLLTMLVTRWGDHHTTSKSLVFSVVLHLSTGFGVVVLAPAAMPLIEQLTPSEPIKLKSVTLEADAAHQANQNGNVPVWETLPNAEEILKRSQFEAVDWLEQARLAKLKQQQIDQAIAFDQQTPLPDATPAPIPKASEAMETPNERVAAELNLNAPEAIVRPAQVDQQTMAARTQRSTSAPQFRPESQTKLGATDRIQMDLLPEQSIKSIEQPDWKNDSPDSPAIPQGDLASVIKRRSAAEIAMNSELEQGTEQTQTADSSKQMGQVNRSRLPRQQTTFKDGRDRPNRSTGIGEVNVNPENLPAMEAFESGPLASLNPINPEMTNPDFQPLEFNPNATAETANVPATYRLRTLSSRSDIARKNGGTVESERAVEAALRWLSSTQSTDGYWDGSAYGSGTIAVDEEGVDRLSAGLHSDTGLTALSILAFLGAGYTQEEGPYQEPVDRAIRWLMSIQKENGFLGGEATDYAAMYCHGIATYALAEALGMQANPQANAELRKTVQKAVDYILAFQNPDDGGWRYKKGWQGDMSMFGWQLMALKSAEIAGLKIPDQNRKLMIQFLQESSLGERKGLAAYHRQFAPLPTPSMTAEALFCKQILGLKRNNPSSAEAVEYLLTYAPKASEENLYYWYYGTLCMYQFGGNEWEQWNNNVRTLLIENQITNGNMAGSWDPKGPWGGYGGRIYSTALATLSLEVYYRFLPLYRQATTQFDFPEQPAPLPAIPE